MRGFRWVVLCAAALAACNDEEKTYQLNNEGGVPPTVDDAGKQVGSDGGQQHSPSDTGPVVDLQNVLGTVDPLQGPVLTGASLDVTCQAKQRTRGAAVDITSVKVQLFDASGKALDEAPLTSMGVDTFKGSVSLGKVPTGLVRVRCIAKDTTPTTPLSNYGEVTTYFDGGPTVTFQGLDEMSIVPRGNDKLDEPEFTIKFTVDPAPLAANDPSAVVTDVTLSVRDSVVQPTKEGNAFSYPIDFKTLVGTTPIEELKIVVTAANSRTPPAVATKQLVVKVDSKPPVITVMTPTDGAIVGGRVTAQLTISDDLSGVSSDAKKTFATVGDREFKKQVPLVPVPGKPGSYTFDFEAASFPNLSIVPINITALDNVGNSTIKSLSVKFDTVPPWVSLASPNVRECNVSTKLCSGPFKALGNSPQDGDTIASNARFRMLVWERGIKVSGATETWISKVADATVAIYAQRRDGKPLVIDTNNDRICDTLDDDLNNGVVRNGMSPVSVGGALPPAADLTSDPAVVKDILYGPLTGATPATKCGSEMSYAISQSAPERPTAVYAFGVDTTSCTGVSFGLGTTAGWTCVVGAATDNSGNIGISMPIRVCRKPDANDNSVDCSGPPPATLTCTDGCTMPTDSSVNWLGDRVFEY